MLRGTREMGRHGGRHRIRRRTETTSSITSTGTHRAVGRRRGVAAWPIACVVLLGLLVAGWFGWNWADGVLESRAAAQAAACPGGDATIRVAVDPALDGPVGSAADRWNRKGTVVREHCIHVEVHAAPSDDVAAVLTGDSDPATIGGYPAAWIPDSPERIDALADQHPELIGSSGLTVASGPDGDYPFLALAGEHSDGTRQHAAQSFQKFLLEPAQQKAFREAGLTPAKG